nr:MAG TPA: hypothetical protein [Caudoviricetes sp.]
MNAPSVAASTSFEFMNPLNQSNNELKKLLKEIDTASNSANSKMINIETLNDFPSNSIYETIAINSFLGQNKKIINSETITINLDYSDFAELKEEEKAMNYHLNKAKNAENVLFYLGMFVGFFILSSTLIANAPVSLALPSSFFGFGAAIPKIRRMIYGK